MLQMVQYFLRIVSASSPSLKQKFQNSYLSTPKYWETHIIGTAKGEIFANIALGLKVQQMFVKAGRAIITMAEYIVSLNSGYNICFLYISYICLQVSFFSSQSLTILSINFFFNYSSFERGYYLDLFYIVSIQYWSVISLQRVCIQQSKLAYRVKAYYNTQLSQSKLMKQSSQNRLYAWGKGYSTVKEISKDVKILAAGQSHCIFGASNNQFYGFGSNKFGQLGLPDLTSQNQLKKLTINVAQNGNKINIQSLSCGAEHTFFITDKHEVYSMGLNIKGQLGQGNFQNLNKPKLVVSLLPHGIKNPKSLNPALSRQSKPPIVELLEKFDLQVKVEEQPIENILLLQSQEYITEISCGALFTIAISNKGRVFGCGYQGFSVPESSSINEEYMEKSKFKLIQIDGRIISVSCGLSGSVALSQEGQAYVWGRFGKLIYNIPKKVSNKALDNILSRNQEDRYAMAKAGDQFVALLTVKGEVYTFGENIDNQLGTQSQSISFRANLEKVQNLPLVKNIEVGRNHCFAVTVNNEVFGWGSNRYNQIGFSQSYPMIMKPKNLSLTVSQNIKIFPSSYCTFAISSQKLNFTQQSSPQKGAHKQEQMIKLSQYKKLVHDYQILKSLNLTLLEKSQPPKKISQQVQTLSKFDIDGVTKFRQFGSNVQIDWSQLEIIQRINEGGYGVIYKAKWREILVVVKKFKIQNGDVSLRDFLSQCNAMEAVRHPFIVMFLGAVTKAKNYSIILQYCSRGSLWSYLQNQQNPISWEDRKRFAIEIAQGVHYLHSCTPPILHRDLKSLNIFLDVHLRIKIGDFGWTKTLDEYMTNKIGTYQWMAPQVIGNKPYTEKADVFSYSIILWEIASRQPPYRNITGAKVSQAVLYNEMRPQIPKKTPEPFARLMRKCWDSDPNKRPTFKQIIRELEVMKLN